MSILLAFAPFIVFALGDHFFGVTPGLIAAAVLALAMLLQDVLMRGKQAKVLEVGTVLLFGGLAAISLLVKPAWSVILVRLMVDAGLFSVVLLSLMIRQPFTLQYAREQAPKEVWGEPIFVRLNYVLTTVWALAFLIMAGADVFMMEARTAPMWIGVAASLAALGGAGAFTSWYPDRIRSQARAREQARAQAGDQTPEQAPAPPQSRVVQA